MKKLFLGAIAAMTLAACSQEDIETSSSNEVKKVNGIEYNVSTKNQTRVAASYSSTNLPGSFKVWAVKSDKSNYIDGETITKGTDGTYAGTKTYSWPGESLNFFATVNDGDKAAVSNGAATITDFTVNSDAAKQVDLLYASTQNVSSGTVGINFKHALSQVCFKASKSNSNISVTIKSVGIGGLYDKGTYTLPSTTSETTGKWSSLANSETGLAEYKVSLGDGIALSSEAQALTGSTDAGILAVIPQKQSKLTVKSDTKISTSTKDGAYFIINAEVKSSDTNAKEIYSGDIYVPVSVNFVEGTRYIYTLTFSTGDGGYRDNTSEVINGSSDIEFSVKTDNYSDDPIDTEASTTLMQKYTPTLDCWLRSDKATTAAAGNASNNTMEVKTYTTSEEGKTSTYYYGLMSFKMPESNFTTNYTVTSAKIVLTSRFIKGKSSMALYDFGGDALLETEPTYPGTQGEALTLTNYTKISDFTANGTTTALNADNITNSNYFTLSAWQTEIDITDYINSKLKTDYINLLFTNNESSSNSNVFFTTGLADDFTMKTKDGDNAVVETTISAKDVQPYIIIKYAEKSTTE